MKAHPRSSRRIVAALAAVALLATACSDQDDTVAGDGGTDGDGGTETSTASDTDGDAAVDKPPVTIGIVGARVGPISNVGEGVAEAVTDWFDMLNQEGGIAGRQVELLEIETEYQVPLAVDAYGRMKQQDAAAVLVLGSALSDALKPQSEEDEIPILFPGQGNAQLASGEQNPYAFPASPTYPHQASALVQWAADDWADTGGDGTAVATCTEWDTPPGKEFCDAVEEAAAEVGFDVAVRNGVAPGSVDALPQVLEVKQANPDYAFHSTVFGQATAFLNAACDENLETTMLTWHWAITENEVAAAGADCLARMNYTGAFMSTMPVSDPQALQMLRDFWESTGQDPSQLPETNQLYGNGLAVANLLAEGVRQADEIAGDGEITGAIFKQALESIESFTGNGTLCETTVTPSNHSGNRALNLYQVTEDGSFESIAECVEGPVLPSEPDLEG